MVIGERAASRHQLFGAASGQKNPELAAQWAAVEALGARHEAERQALTDSLGLTAPGAVPVSRWQRTSRLFVRQLGEVRQLLTPAQRPVFDARVRTWLAQYTEPSWQVAVPWLTP